MTYLSKMDKTETSRRKVDRSHQSILQKSRNNNILSGIKCAILNDMFCDILYFLNAILHIW